MRDIRAQSIYDLNSEIIPMALKPLKKCLRQHVGGINSLAHIHQFELQPNDPLCINENVTKLPHKVETLLRSYTGITPTQDVPALTGMS